MGRRDTWQQWNNTLKLKATEKKILTWHRQACTWDTHTVHLPNDPWEADVPRNVFSDWLKCPWGWWRKCDERLTGGEGEAEWKEAELPRDPGIFTGAELCSKLPPGQRTHREDGYVWPWGVGTGRRSEQEVSGSLSSPWAPRDSLHFSWGFIPLSAFKRSTEAAIPSPTQLRTLHNSMDYSFSGQRNKRFSEQSSVPVSLEKINLVSGETLHHKKFTSKTCASAFDTSKQPVVGELTISTTKNQWLAVVTHTWVPGSISNKKPQINKSLTTKDINFPTQGVVLLATLRFREISALLSPHRRSPGSTQVWCEGEKGRIPKALQWGAAAAAGLAAHRDSKPPTGSNLWEVEVKFFPQVLSYLNTAPGSAVPLETFRQAELAPVLTPALHSKDNQKLQPFPKTLRFFFSLDTHQRQAEEALAYLHVSKWDRHYRNQISRPWWHSDRWMALPGQWVSCYS